MARRNLVQLPEAEAFEVTGKKAYGLASAVLRDWRQNTKVNCGNFDIKFSERNQCIVVSGVGRWKDEGMEKAARELSKEFGFYVEELNRFISWVVLKRIHHNQCLPALYENTKFIERAIYVMLKGAHVTMEHGPTQQEYGRFLNHVRGGQRNFNLSILTQIGMVRYLKTMLQPRYG